MSASKKLKTDTSLSPPLCLETEATPETAWLYTLAPGKPIYSIYRIYPIIPKCGVSLTSEIFYFERSKETCCIFSLSKNCVAEKSNAFTTLFPGSKMMVFAENSCTHWLRFVLFLEVGSTKSDASGDDSICRIDTMVLQPATLTLQLAKGSEWSTSFELNFFPGVTGYFKGWEMESRENEADIIYHAVVWRSDSQWSWRLADFLEFTSGEPLLTLQITKAEVLPTTSDLSSGDYKLEWYKMLTPFALVSKDGQTYPCYKEILCDRIPTFSKRLSKNATEMKLEEGARSTELFLEYVYHPQNPLGSCVTVEVVLGLLKLAHYFQISDLIATTANRLIREIGNAKSTELWHLFGAIHPLKNEIQILFKLWKVLMTEIRRLILDEDCSNLDYVGFYSRCYFLNLKSFAEYGLERDKLLENLGKDLEVKNVGESDAEHLRIQFLFKRFQSEVICKLSSYDRNQMSPPSSSSASPSSSTSSKYEF